MNFRKKAGTNYKSYGLLESGQDVTILGWCSNQGMKWYKCKTKINGKNKTGYVCADYVKRKSNASAYVNNKVTSTLNVRKKAKASSKSLMKIPSGTALTIRGIAKKSGKYWYKVKVTYKKKTKTGYVPVSYTHLTLPTMAVV